MRLSFIAALLSVGFFAGCGGVEPEAQAQETQDVTAMAPPPCERACMTLYNYCMQTATTPEEQAWCVEDRTICYQDCSLGAAPVQAMAPGCREVCNQVYASCKRNATTPEATAYCVEEHDFCYSQCL
ncbi:hypothetical protein D7W79_37970 [Corallococcus exercitus]|uniref:hypothetical protein n=1 Tax=Corallococcus exercitus TaxID=2316736 RepID=UPI000EA342FA|nr:hypothetical protein [Corallococcus exercitus]RKG65371.1 hypothetical protein D7W79_37970 [Corallococcus exercitus]